MSKFEDGRIVKAVVTGIESYGIFVSLDDYYTGLIHISEISHKFVRNIHSFVKIGDTISVKIIGVDEQSAHLKLSIKDINYMESSRTKRKGIQETAHGFNTLRYKLPFWIEETSKKYKKTKNPIDN